MPTIIASAPVILPHEVFWWNAYCELAESRPYHLVTTGKGMLSMPGAIPSAQIRAYADRYHVPYHHLKQIVQALDKARQ